MSAPDEEAARKRTWRLRPGERVRRGADYRRIYDQARSHHGRLFVAFIHQSEDLARRAGFVAGRRVGGAVERNRARRMLKESYRRLKNELPERGFQVVFVARARCAASGLLEVDREMRELLQKSGVLPQ